MASNKETQFADLDFMRMAVDQAKVSKSKQMKPEDPAVGAVVISADGDLLAQTHRSEYEAGQHAEYVALEVKLAKQDLAGATIYTTLEPCIDVRSPKKTDCAVRIVDRGIREVVVGMLDPNIRVCAKGLRYLQDNSVQIRYFPNDFTEQLDSLNRAFVQDQAAPFQDAKQLSHVRLSYVDDVTPDSIDILLYEQHMFHIKETEEPAIRWPTLTERLYRQALREREITLKSRRLEDQSMTIEERRRADLTFIKYQNELEIAQLIRRNASSQITSLWQRIQPFRFAYQPVVEGMLWFANARMQLGLYMSQRFPVSVASPQLQRWQEGWSSTKSLSPWFVVYNDLFPDDAPFYAVELSFGGISKGEWRVYVPRDHIKRWFDEGSISTRRGSYDYLWPYVVPQIEVQMIFLDRSDIPNYDEHMTWRKIIGPDGNEPDLMWWI